MRGALAAGLLLVACSGEPEDVEPSPAAASMVVQSPLPADNVASGDLEVSGISTGLAQVKVNEVSADLAGGVFSGTVPVERGANLIEVVGVQEDGDVLYQRFGVLAGDTNPAQGAAPYENSTLLRLNESGLDLIMDLAADLAASVDLGASLAATGPLIDESWLGSFGLFAELSSAPDAVLVEGISLSANPQSNGFLKLDAVVENIHVELDVIGTALWIDIPGTITVDTGLAAEVMASLDVADGLLVVEAGIERESFALTPFRFSTSITGPLFDELFDGMLQDFVTPVLLDQMDALLPTMIDTLLADFQTLEFPLALMETEVILAASWADAGIDGDGVFFLMDAAVDLDATCPEGAVYLASPEGITPVPPSESDAGGAISDEVMNGLLLDTWCTGLLELELTSDDPDLGAMVGLLLEPLQVTEGTVAISAMAPPVLVEKRGGLALQVTELLMTIDTPGRLLGETITVMLHVDADLDISIVDNTPRLILGETFVTVMSRDHDWGASHEATTKLLEEALAPILDSLPTLLNVTLASTLGTPIELDLFGLSIAEATVSRDAGGAHLLLDVTLGYDPSQATLPL